MNSSGKIRVLVVDDSAFMRSRIKRDLAAAGFEVIGEARNGREAVQQYTHLQPDVVTMDLTMRDCDGIEGTRGILDVDSNAAVVIFSLVDDETMVAEALRAGVKEYVNKSEPERLIACLRSLGGNHAT